MSKPEELAEAEMILNMCRMYHALPEAGGLMDQPVWLLTLHGIMSAAGAAPVAPWDDPLADLPMVTL